MWYGYAYVHAPRLLLRPDVGQRLTRRPQKTRDGDRDGGWSRHQVPLSGEHVALDPVPPSSPGSPYRSLRQCVAFASQYRACVRAAPAAGWVLRVRRVAGNAGAFSSPWKGNPGGGGGLGGC